MAFQTPLSNDELIERARLLVKEIDAAFDDVMLKKGTTLQEAKKHDRLGRYKPSPRRSAPRNDEFDDKNWRQVSINEEDYRLLHFMDTNGFAFHIAACMTVDLHRTDKKTTDDLALLLTGTADENNEKFARLTDPQRRCCGLYVEYWVEREFSKSADTNDRQPTAREAAFAPNSRLRLTDIKSAVYFYTPYLQEDEAQRFKQRWLT